MRRAIAAVKAALAKARGERARVSARVSSDDEASVGRTADGDAPPQSEDSSHSRSSLQSAAKKAILLGGVVTKLKRAEPPAQSSEPVSRGFAGTALLPIHKLIKSLGHLSEEAGGGSL